MFVTQNRTDICYLSVPLVLVAVASYLVAHCFLGVYGKAIDTIFMCFCIDCEQNNGNDRPYFMNKGLMVRKYSIYIVHTEFARSVIYTGFGCGLF